MRFEKMNDYLPYVKGGKVHVLGASLYPGVDISMPGRHALDTTPVGGDGVVLISDDCKKWVKHPFTHNDIFRDVELRKNSSHRVDSEIMEHYSEVILGADPSKYDLDRGSDKVIHPQTFLYAVQILSIIEHRRYAKFEAKFGGRFLPFRFAAGIDEGLWTAAEAADKQKYGRPGVEQLEKEKGKPKLTQELMK